VPSAAGAISLRHAPVLPVLDKVNGGAVVVFALPEAQRVFDRVGRLDAIYVLPGPSVSVAVLKADLQRAVGPWNGVLTATDPPPALAVAASAITPLLALLALLASVISVMLVYNIVNLSLMERRRQRAIVAAIGAPPTVLVGGPVVEAVLIGAVGGALGAAGGSLLAAPTVHAMSGYSSQLLGVPITVHAPPVIYLVGLLLGSALGVAAALRPVWRALRVDVVAELSGRDRRIEERQATSPLRGALLVALVLVGLLGSWAAQRHGALAPWQPGATTLAFLLCVFATTLAIGFWVPVVVGAAARRRGWWGVARVAMSNVQREPGRTAVVAVAVASSVGVALMTASYNTSIHDAIAHNLGLSFNSRSVFVTPVESRGGFNTDGRIPASVLDAAGRLPGVSQVRPYRVVLSGHASGQQIIVETSDTLSGGPAVDLGRVDGAAYRRGEVMVGPAVARRLRLSAGSTLLLDTPTRTSPVTVEGVWENGDFTGNNVTMTTYL
jgi:putative ABC transport system permease protein